MKEKSFARSPLKAPRPKARSATTEPRTSLPVGRVDVRVKVPKPTGVKPYVEYEEVMRKQLVKRGVGRNGIVNVADLRAAAGSLARQMELATSELPTKIVSEFSALLSVPDEKILNVLCIPTSTMHRWVEKRKPLPREKAEVAVRLAEFTTIAEGAFGDATQGLRWLREAQPGLGGRVPIDMLATSYGAEAVRRALVMIQYGGVL